MKRNKNTKNKKIKYSIVTPAYKTEKVIKNTLTELKRTLDKTRESYEIICVVDGEVDDTLKIADTLAKKNSGKIKVYSYEKNRGKGYAVRFGFLKTEGDYIGFIDSDGDISPENLLTLIKIIKKEKADAVVGSKNHKDSHVDYPTGRKMISVFSQFFIKTLLNTGVSDTQAGVKLFTKDLVKSVAPKLTISRFAFDLELLAVARKMGFKKIIEAPIKVNLGRAGEGKKRLSTVSAKDLVYTFIEAVTLFYRINFTDKYTK